MTANFDQIVQVALLGTDRQPPPAPDPNSALGKFQGQVESPSAEEKLLSLAALAATHQRVGSLAALDNGPLPAPAPAEPCRRASPRAGQSLLRLLRGEFKSIALELIGEWARLASETAQLAPPETLPLLLDMASDHSELRKGVEPILGERGRWLAQFTSAWAWANAIGEEIVWETAQPAARLAYLERLRATAPDAARDLLAAVWKEESPEDRLLLLSSLEPALSAKDEEFLNQALRDKRKEVRRAAAALLVRIPESAFSKTVLARGLEALRFVPGPEGRLLKRAERAWIEVTLPGEQDHTFSAQGIDTKPPKGIGEKAWFIIQLTELLPLNAWTEAWKVAVPEIVAAAFAGDWGANLLEGWTRAAIAQKNSDWAAAIFPKALELEKYDRLGPLLEAMTPSAAEENLSLFLQTTDDKRGGFIAQLVGQTAHAFSPAFTGTLLDWLRQMAARDSGDWQLRNNLMRLAPRLAPELLPRAALNWPIQSAAWDFWGSGVDEFISAAQFRHQMIEAIRDPSL